MLKYRIVFSVQSGMMVVVVEPGWLQVPTKIALSLPSSGDRGEKIQ